MTDSARRTRLTGLALGLVPVFLWGLSFVATKAALADVEPLTLVLGRTALATLSLTTVCLLRRRPPRLPQTALVPLIGAGALGVFLHQILQAYGLTLTTAVRTGWLIGVIPIWSAVIALLFLRESLSVPKAVGLLLGLMGVGLLVTGGRMPSLLPQTLGDLLILASTVSWAIYTVLGRYLMGQVDALLATTLAMAVGLAMLLPITGLAPVWNSLADASPRALAAVLFLGLGCSGLAYLLWYAALERAPAAEVASLLYLEPLVTLAAAIAFLGESVEATTLAGGVIVLAGVYLVQRSAKA